MKNKKRLDAIQEIKFNVVLSEPLKNTFNREEKTYFVIDILDGVERKLGRQFTKEEQIFAINLIHERFDYYMDIYPWGAIQNVYGLLTERYI